MRRQEKGDALGLVSRYIEQIMGADIAGHLSGRVEAHVHEEMVALGLLDPSEYLEAIRRGDDLSGRMLDGLLAAVLVHETFFYRFASQLRAFESRVLPDLLSDQSAPVKIWSAGCSRGPEPYTIAMIAARAMKLMPDAPPVEILATDLCGAFLEVARRATYREEKFKELPKDLADLFLRTNADGSRTVTDTIRSMVRFRRHNLLEPALEQGFDVISCRNVLMYLRPAERRRALEHLVAALVPGGILLVGHSESLRDAPDLLAPDRRFTLGIYRKAGDSLPALAQGMGPLAPTPPLPPARTPSAGVRPPAPPPAPPAADDAERPSIESIPDRKSYTDLLEMNRAMMTQYVRLEGDYDAVRTPGKLEELKGTLVDLVDGGNDIVIAADDATMLDNATARLIARAVRTVESRGGRLVLWSTREAVVRWAERNRLPVQRGDPGEGTT